MELDWIWKSVLIVMGGTFLLRFAGRKSISQMTLAQMVITIEIGSLLVQPFTGKSVWTTLGVGGILVLTLIVMEYLQMKSDGVEKLITGKSKIVIENGMLNEKNLMKLRVTVDQLEMILRLQNVSKISDVKWATLEPNGHVGCELKEEAKPVTNKEFQSLQQDIQQLKQLFNLNSSPVQQQDQSTNEQDLFSEVDSNSHKIDPPKHLQ
ncbi:DUF421 domain-containing protein [Jeotgalibacillus marinus]|uniref:DUF421 domain-containing protein n=1 Tax=Jeotgalibacillus marinus TaxID=86667 RepID=A0ABV3Q858_9BACL